MNLKLLPITKLVLTPVRRILCDHLLKEIKKLSNIAAESNKCLP